MRFSERIGKRPIKSVLQIDSIDGDLENRLWNAILEDFFENIHVYEQANFNFHRDAIYRAIWKDFFKNKIDEIPTTRNEVYERDFMKCIRNWWFNKAKWFDMYDLIEFISAIDSVSSHGTFTDACNEALEKEVSGYRIINNKVVQITSEEEVQEIEDAINDTQEWKSVNQHLLTSLSMLADRKSPDYRNSIKESISAVEATCIIITGDSSATLGKTLNEIEKKHSLHGALKGAFSSIYGYTSDSGGIRHALTEDNLKVEFEDAKFMLVVCSAFINYLKTKLKI